MMTHPLVSGVFGGVPPSTLLSGLSLYLKLDEAGGTRSDSSGNVTALTDNNTCLSAAGQVGNAVALVAASSQYLSHASVAALGVSGAFTLSVWARLATKTATMRLISKDDGASREYILYYDTSADRWTFAVFVGGVGGGFTSVVASTFGAVPTATWHYVVAGYNAVAQQVFVGVNGGAQNTTGGVASVFDGTSVFEIGAGAGGQYFDGAADEVKLWNTRMLSSAEIAEDRANGLAGRALL